MRWFKHMSDARHNPKVLRLLQRLGEAGYARYFRLLECLAERGGTGSSFNPGVDLQDGVTDLAWLAGEMGCRGQSDARKTLELFAKVRLIDQRGWKRKKVCVPQMIEYRDEWASRKQKPDTRETHKRLPSTSRVTREESQKSESESESNPKTQAESDAEATAAQNEFLRKSKEVAGRKVI